MTRQTAVDNSQRFAGEDDDWYRGYLVKPDKGWLQAGDPKYGEKPVLVIELGVKGESGTARDMIGIALGQRRDGTVSKLRQLLNALAEHDKDDELWFDDDTLEWGYDMAEDAAAEAKLTEGMEVAFRGENRDNGKGKAYRITAYRKAAKPKAAK